MEHAEETLRETLAALGDRRIATDVERIVVGIRDSGPGIAPEHLPHIFNPFYSPPVPVSV